MSTMAAAHRLVLAPVLENSFAISASFAHAAGFSKKKGAFPRLFPFCRPAQNLACLQPLGGGDAAPTKPRHQPFS